jgi:type IV secretion system protein VirD4
MSSFVTWIEGVDARHGIPRPAEMQSMPAYQAFLRLMSAVLMMVMLTGFGCVCAYLLWLSAGYLEVSYQTKLIFVAVMLLCMFVGGMEALQEVLPYYRIQQRLTFGTGRWADEVYLRAKGFAVKVEALVGGLPRGFLRLGLLKRGYSLVLPEVEWLRHIVIFGPPGSGKSKTYLMGMLRDIARGGSAIVLDPKGELFEQTALAFRQMYRLDLVKPSRSDRWNFLLKCKDSPEFAGQMAATMIGLEGTKHSLSTADPFWQESSLLLLKAVLLHLADIVQEPTPPMIYEYLALRDMATIQSEMLNSPNGHVRLAWGAFQKAPPPTQGSVLTSLMSKLGTFQEENAQKICAPRTESDIEAGVRQIDFARLREPGTVIYIVVAEGDATRYKNVLSTFIGQAVNELRIDAHEIEVAPVAFVLDEAANVPLVGLKEIAGVGRGRKIGLILGYQNLAQVHDQYGTDGGNAILGSIGTMIFLPGLDDVTTQFASRRIGQTTVWSHTTVDGKGKSLDNERQSETGRALMDPTELRQMVKHQQCVVIIDSQPPIKASYPPLAMSRQRAMAVDYGEPRLLTLLQGEEAYLTVLAAKLKDELDAQRLNGGAPDPDGNNGIPPLVPETIDGGQNYGTQSAPVATTSDVAGSVTAASGGEAKRRRSTIPDNQGTLLFSDQAVEETLVGAAKVVVGTKAPASVIRTVTVRKPGASVVADDLVVSGAAGSGPSGQHDALR